ncbi:unnamed protein product [Moneuplotes crassus]|uniref:Uncharacterized protein n=1 Tax=Euplotes crassus TaxID=5936 RepID=A0AAD1X732_EUPCR|nr:unnamed protein product [Moneuplotes crassus]
MSDTNTNYEVESNRVDRDIEELNAEKTSNASPMKITTRKCSLADHGNVIQVKEIVRSMSEESKGKITRMPKNMTNPIHFYQQNSDLQHSGLLDVYATKEELAHLSTQIEQLISEKPPLSQLKYRLEGDFADFRTELEGKLKKFRKDINQKLDKAVSTFMHVKVIKNGTKMLVPVNKYLDTEIEKIKSQFDSLARKINIHQDSKILDAIEKLQKQIDAKDLQLHSSLPPSSLSKLQDDVTDSNERISQILNERKMLYTSILNTDSRINEVNAYLKIIEQDYQNMNKKLNQEGFMTMQKFLSLSDRETSDVEDMAVTQPAMSKRIMARKIKNRLKKVAKNTYKPQKQVNQSEILKKSGAGLNISAQRAATHHRDRGKNSNNRIAHTGRLHNQESIEKHKLSSTSLFGLKKHTEGKNLDNFKFDHFPQKSPKDNTFSQNKEGSSDIYWLSSKKASEVVPYMGFEKNKKILNLKKITPRNILRVNKGEESLIHSALRKG